ncbi:MAG TPA: HNH endonuclease signature motif containing protein [Polyangiales bacterium]|nr:HNH endonuclease signature motif containing protein [Polyangiales bacterium]
MQRLLRDERRLSARLLVHLGEVDARQLYRQHAYSSMFEYCVQALHLSESEAYLRIGAARLGRRYPRVLQMFASGELHLSALKLLAPVLDDTNSDELLSAARFKSKRDVELLLAQRRERPDVPSVIRRLPRAAAVAQAVSSNTLQTDLLTTASDVPQQQREPAAEPPRPAHVTAPSEHTAFPQRSTVSPLGADRYKVQFTASKQLHDKLRQAQDIMRHEIATGAVEQVLERALDLLIGDRMKRRFGQTSKPRRARSNAAPKPGGRHIPNAVKREVIERDGSRCTFVGTDGKRCEQRGWLQLHHEDPYARGGTATSDNIHVMCAPHNRLLAERDFGRAFVQQRIERARDRGARDEFRD